MGLGVVFYLRSIRSYAYETELSYIGLFFLLYFFVFVAHITNHRIAERHRRCKMLVSVKNEPIIRSQTGGRWEYAKDMETGWRGYLHMDCDVVCDDSGHCIMCGAPCPTLWGVK